MLLIPCPWCGPRDQTEFTYGGDATVERPATPEAATAEDWAAYVYARRNARGPHLEYWQHSAACRKWIKVARDTATHEIVASGPANQELKLPTKCSGATR